MATSLHLLFLMPKKVTKKGTNAKNLTFPFSQTLHTFRKSKIHAGLRCPSHYTILKIPLFAKWFGNGLGRNLAICSTALNFWFFYFKKKERRRRGILKLSYFTAFTFFDAKKSNKKRHERQNLTFPFSQTLRTFRKSKIHAGLRCPSQHTILKTIKSCKMV